MLHRSNEGLLKTTWKAKIEEGQLQCFGHVMRIRENLKDSQYGFRPKHRV